MTSLYGVCLSNYRFHAIIVVDQFLNLKKAHTDDKVLSKRDTYGDVD